MKSKQTNKRIKLALATIGSREEAEALVNEIAGATLNKIKLAADQDEEINAVKERYAAGIAACDESIESKTEALVQWAQANPGEFLKGLKSIKFAAGIVGFRTGKPKLALLNRYWNWEKVLAALRTFRGWARFIRTIEEVDKETILAAHAANEIEEGSLVQFGVKVVQGESFYVDPDLTKVETRQVHETSKAA